MNVDLGLLVLTAASVGFIHTLLGPDHYVPFVAMSAARRWSTRRTMWVTSLCGLGHVGGSVVIGALGIGIGVSLHRLEWFEGMRGDAAAWLLTAFGVTYLAWGLKKASRSRPHAHEHSHGDGTFHRHVHGHEGAHLHPHLHLHHHPHGNPLAPPRADGEAPANITPWALFVVFVLGPCEPLIPVLMYPAAKHSLWGTTWVVVAFGTVTVATMMAVVYLGIRGVKRLPLDTAERYSHALAGAAISICGLGILLLGL
jgi:nickel/cobalt exporter